MSGMEVIVGLVAAILTPIAVFIGQALVKYIAAKTGAEVSDNQDMVIDRVIREAVAFAEEQALKALKSSVPMDSAAKLDTAVAHALKELDAFGVTLSADRISAKIEAVLSLNRKYM